MNIYKTLQKLKLIDDNIELNVIIFDFCINYIANELNQSYPFTEEEDYFDFLEFVACMKQYIDADRLNHDTINIIIILCFGFNYHLEDIKILIDKYNIDLTKRYIYDNLYISCYLVTIISDLGNQHMNYLVDKEFSVCYVNTERVVFSYNINNTVLDMELLHKVCHEWGDLKLCKKILKLCGTHKVSLHPDNYIGLMVDILNFYRYDYIYPLVKFNRHTNLKCNFYQDHEFGYDFIRWFEFGSTHPFDTDIWYKTAQILVNLGIIPCPKKYEYFLNKFI